MGWGGVGCRHSGPSQWQREGVGHHLTLLLEAHLWVLPEAPKGGLSGGNTNPPPGFQLTTLSRQPQTKTQPQTQKPHRERAPTR